MKQQIRHIVNHLFPFSRTEHVENNPEIEHNDCRLNTPEMDDENLPSNVLRGTNPDLTPQTACQGESPETPAPAEAKTGRQRKDCRIKIRFTSKELADVKRRAKEAGTDCSKYIRAKLRESQVIPAPNVDAAALRMEVNRVGRHIDDIRARAYAVGFIDVPELHKALEEVHAVHQKLSEAYSMKGGERHE